MKDKEENRIEILYDIKYMRNRKVKNIMTTNSIFYLSNFERRLCLKFDTLLL